MTQLAPIALFAYRRRGHLERVLSALRSNILARDSYLVIFCDGPRGPSDSEEVEAVRREARRATGFRHIEIREASENQGLALSLTTGLDFMLYHWDRVIVVEDDILVSRHFLDYMNHNLANYENSVQVASIHGAVYPHSADLPETFFIRGADCWGWATWRRAWEVFEPDGAQLLKELQARGLLDAFNFEGTAPFEEMLIDQVEGRIDSWAIRWYASTLLNEMLTLYPRVPMAVNIGEDGTGTHGSSRGQSWPGPYEAPLVSRQVPILESSSGREAFRRYFRTRYRIPTSKLGRLAWRRARRLRQSLRT